MSNLEAAQLLGLDVVHHECFISIGAEGYISGLVQTSGRLSVLILCIHAHAVYSSLAVLCASSQGYRQYFVHSNFPYFPPCMCVPFGVLQRITRWHST